MSALEPHHYEPIIRLISDFESFERETGSRDRFAFAIWLLKQADTRNVIQLSEPIAKKEVSECSAEVWMDRVPNLEDQITFFLGRLAQFLRHYVRDAFHGLEISSIDDFSLLAAISLLDHPTKSEVYQVAASSVTTGAETLRRFIALGLVEETVDARDRRVRRVSLTVKGEEVVAAATTRMSLVARVATADLTIEEKESLRGILSKLHTFHESQFKVGETLSAKNVLANRLPRAKTGD